MNTKEFLEKVLGDEGYYCIVGLLKDSDKPVQKFYSSLEDAIKVAEQLKDNGYDAYYALATFEDDKSRKVPNVKQLRSFFVDLDCGPHKDYESQQDALSDLKRFCKVTNLPRPTLVNSGGGIHAYWTLTEPVSRETWLPVAEKLKSLCDDHDLFADPVVTADPARILRVPGTLNYKNDTPRDVCILGEVSESISFEAVKELIGEEVKAKTFVPRGEMDEATKAILGNYTNRFKTILLKTVKGEGCQQLAYIIENQETMSEPMWRAGLSIAKWCIDSDKAVFKISNRHPEYSLAATDKKVRNIKGGPYTCAKFEEYRPGGCKGCPNWGVVKSPIVLGREVQEATEEDNIVEDVPADIEQGHTQTYIIPKYPNPYFRGKNGGIFKKVIKEEDEIDVLIYHNDIYVTRRLEDADVGEAVVIRLHLPKDGVREFTVPLAAVTSKDEFRKHMASHGVAVLKMDEIMSYVTTWVNHLQYSAKADQARRQFGWTDDKHEAFVLGDREIRADRVDHNPPSVTTAQMIKAFEPKGSFEVWKEAMRFYKRPGMEMHQFVIGLGFGSIFSDFTAINGALLHIHSKESGIGKTTSMIAGASIWGYPKKLMLKESDTTASKMNRAELYKNLCLWLDEVTNASAKELSDFVYQYTDGSQRNRLSSSQNIERVRGIEWKQNAVSTGNASIMQKIAVIKASPKGEAMRVLEVRALPVEGLEKEETDALSTTLLNNYGHASLPYLQYIMNDIKGIKEMYKAVQVKLDTLAGFGPADRFHSVLITNAIMGLMTARKAGLIDYEVKPVIDWVMGVVAKVKEENSRLDVDVESSLTNYLSENYNNILRIKSTDDARSIKTDGLDHLILPESTPRAAFIARYEYDIKMMYLYQKPLKEWCTKQQINYEGLLEGLKKGRTKAKIDKKRMGKGTHMNLPSIDVIHLDCSGFLDDEQEKALADGATHRAAVEGDAG